MRNELPKVHKRHWAGCYTCGELADMLGLPHETLIYHVKRGYIPAPGTALCKRKYYSLEEALRVMDYFGGRRPYERQRSE
jgi:hypothetical protein